MSPTMHGSESRDNANVLDCNAVLSDFQMIVPAFA